MKTANNLSSRALRGACYAAALMCAVGNSQAQSSVSIFGTIDTGVQTRNRSPSDAGKVTEVFSGGIRPNIWGFKGAEDLGGGLKASFTLESHYMSDTGARVSGPGFDSMFRRQANVGVSGDWGAVTLGRQYSPAVIGTIGVEPRAFKEQFSILYVWAYNQLSGPGNPLGAGDSGGNDVGVFIGNAVQYSNTVGPLYVGVAYSFGEQAGNFKRGREISIGATYTGPLVVGFGYQNVADATTGEDIHKLWSLGFAVPYSAITPKFNYVEIKNGDPATGVEISKVKTTSFGVDYKWSDLNTATVAYYHAKYNGVDSSSKTKSLVLSNEYSISKRTILYVQGARVDAGESGLADPLQALKQTIVVDGTAPGKTTMLVGLGINHTF